MTAVANACSCHAPSTVRILAALGDARGALRELGLVADKSPVQAAETAASDPLLADVRRLPRYAALVERIGLIQYWRATKTRPDFCGGPNTPQVCATILRNVAPESSVVSR